MPPSFIIAKEWRKMATRDIIYSVEVGLRVLAEKPLTQEDFNNLIATVFSEINALMEQKGHPYVKGSPTSK